MLWFVYRFLTVLASPFWLAFLALRQGGRFGDRLGFLSARTDRPVWIQAVSAGEVRLAIKLSALLEKRGLPVVVTATTGAGLALLEKEGRVSRAFPADVPLAPRRAFRRLRPRAFVLVETELWPGFIREAARQGVPAVIANGRISDRSLERTLAFRDLFGSSLPNVRVAAQSEEQAERFKSLGVVQDHVAVTGNMKYDLEPPPRFLEQVQAIRTLLPAAAAPFWVAGSVREGEEAKVLEAHRILRRKMAGARLIFAPRHLGRVQVSIEEADKLSLKAARRTKEPGTRWDVLILDTIGELWAAYSLAQAAFVGGSLVPCGGQNPIEPAFLEKPVLFGPHMENFAEPAALLLASGGAVEVDTTEELASELSRLLADANARGAMGRAARDVVQAHRGATEKTARLIEAASTPE